MIAGRMPFGKQSLVENAQYQETAAFLTVEHNVPAVFQAAQAGTNFIAAAAQGGVLGQSFATRLQLV